MWYGRVRVAHVSCACARVDVWVVIVAAVYRLVDDIRDRADVARVFKLLLRYQSGLDNSDDPSPGGLSALCGGTGMDLSTVVPPSDGYCSDGGPSSSTAGAVPGGVSALALDAPPSTSVWKAAPRRTSTAAPNRLPVNDLKASTVLHFMREIQREDDATIEDALRYRWG